MLRASTFALFLLPSILFSQPLIEWERNYGGTDGEIFLADIVQTEDGGYIFTASTVSIDKDVPENRGGTDIWVCKINPIGEVIWSKTFGGTDSDLPSGLFITIEGNILVAGSTFSNDMNVPGNKGGMDIWVFTLNSSGEMIWSKTYGGSNNEGAASIIPTKDGNLLIGGHTYSNDGDFLTNHGMLDVYLMKINPNGAVIWVKTYGGSLVDGGFNYIKMPDDGFVILSGSNSNDGDVGGNYGEADLWLFKVNFEGEIEWSQHYGGSNIEAGNNIVHYGNKFYIAAWSKSDDGDVGVTERQDIWVFEVDEAGNFIRGNTYGGSQGEDPSGLVVLNPDEYIVAGDTDSDDGDIGYYHGNFDFWLIKANNTGKIIWERTYGGSKPEFEPSLISTKDGGFIIAGTSASDDGDVSNNYSSGGIADIWIVKLAPEDVQIVEFCNPVRLFPNPVSENPLVIEFENPSIEPPVVEIYDTAGRLIWAYQKEPIGFNRQLTLDLPFGLSNGIYFLKVTDCSDKPAWLKFVKVGF